MNINEQMAQDLHLLTAPFRLIRSLILITVAIAFAPLLLIGLLVSTHYEAIEYATCMQQRYFSGCAPPAFDIDKVLIGVFGPLVFCIWFAGVVRWSERNNLDYPASGEGGARVGGLTAYFCGMAWLAVFLSMPFCYYMGIEGEAAVWVMVIGLFSPAIFYGIGRWVRA